MVRQNDQQRSALKPILVGIVDKSPLMCTALRTLLGEDDRFQVVCICKNSQKFLEHVGNVVIDVAVVGWVIPPGDARFILD